MSKSRLHTLLLQELEELQAVFPKLELVASGKAWTLQGSIDICDTQGFYWNTFDIVVVVPDKYPYGVPVLFERSELLPRKSHVGATGECCVAMSMDLAIRARRRFSLLDFLREYGRPFFQGQLYFMQTGEYAGGEHRHGFAGRMDWYAEQLGTQDPRVILAILEQVVSGRLPGRNEPCCCGSGLKFKGCHSTVMQSLSAISKALLSPDLVDLRNALENNKLEEVIASAAAQDFA